MKYELIAEGDLFRVKAVRDFAGVKAGELGGLVSGEHNLSQDGDCWVGEQAQVRENARVTGEARVYGSAQVYGDAWLRDGVRVRGNARVTGEAWVGGEARVYGSAWVSEQALVSGEARVYGRAQVHGDARVLGKAWVSGTALVSGNARVFGRARVTEGAHTMHLSGLPSGDVNMFRAVDGYHLSIGCWRGSTDELREMIAGDDWPSALPEEQEERRPALMALADMVDNIVRSWK